jgi:Cu(I)/Ag(I) efflux system membrane fusion protein
MALEPVYAEEASKSLVHSEDSMSGTVQIDQASQQLYGIRLAKVVRGTGQGTITVFGRVAADQSRIYRVNLGTDGFVKETYGDAVGNHVTKDQHLAIVYSPEFLSVAGGYLSANERTPGSIQASKDNSDRRDQHNSQNSREYICCISHRRVHPLQKCFAWRSI